MTRDKKLSFDRRVIFDQSNGPGGGVNGGIPEHWYCGEECCVILPTVDDLADRILTLGRGCLLYSLDVSRAYRVFSIDPRDWPLTGVLFDGQRFVDRAVQFGSRTGALICQMCTLAVTKAFYNQHQYIILVYIGTSLWAQKGTAMPHGPHIIG